MDITGNITWSRQEKILLGVILVLSVLMMAVRWNETPIGSNTDDAYYIEMARSIAEGLGPVINTGPDVVAENPDIFPSGFPWLLSPLAKLFPGSLTAMKILPVFGTLLLIPLCLILPGRQADNNTRLAVTALVMLNPWIIAWSGRVLSDTVFAVLSIAALVVFSGLKKCLGLQKRRFLALVLFCALAISVRTVGWSIVVAISLTLFFRRQFLFGLGFILAVAVMLVPGWIFQAGKVSPITEAYWGQMFASNSGAVWQLMSHNFLHYLAELPVILVPVFGGAVAGAMTRLGLGWLYFPAAFALGCVLLGLMVFAVVRSWRHGSHGPGIQIFSIYLVIYGAVLLNFDGYPTGVQTRLLIPVLPMLCWFVVLGLRHFADRKMRILPGVVFGLMIFASLAHNGWRLAHPLRTSVDAEGRGYVDPGAGADWIFENTSASAVLMVQEPLQRHIHFERDVVGFPDSISEQELLEKLDEFDVGLVFIGPSVHYLPHRLDESGSAMLELMQSMPQVFQAVETNSEEKIYVFSRL